MAETSGTTTLHPGDVAFGFRGDRFETLLGSCVAIVLTDPRRTVGAVCHFVHTRRTASPERAASVYADAALAAMVDVLREHDIEARRCEAYVYGGGNMFPQLLDPSSVGDDNGAWALAQLKAMGVKVLEADVGGNVYRKLQWTVGPQAPHIVAVPV